MFKISCNFNWNSVSTPPGRESSLAPTGLYGSGRIILQQWERDFGLPNQPTHDDTCGLRDETSPPHHLSFLAKGLASEHQVLHSESPVDLRADLDALNPVVSTPRPLAPLQGILTGMGDDRPSIRHHAMCPAMVCGWIVVRRHRHRVHLNRHWRIAIS